MMMSQQSLRNIVAFSFSTGLGSWDASAFAQADQAQAASARSMPVVEITGSRLKRTDTETPSPVDIITRADIAR